MTTLERVLIKAKNNVPLYGDDEVFSFLEFRAVFKAIRDGKLQRVSFDDDCTTYEIRNVTLCKDCIKNGTKECKLNGKNFSQISQDEWFCADGKPKDGNQNG